MFSKLIGGLGESAVSWLSDLHSTRLGEVMSKHVLSDEKLSYFIDRLSDNKVVDVANSGVRVTVALRIILLLSRARWGNVIPHISPVVVFSMLRHMDEVSINDLIKVLPDGSLRSIVRAGIGEEMSADVRRMLLRVLSSIRDMDLRYCAVNEVFNGLITRETKLLFPYMIEKAPELINGIAADEELLRFFNNLIDGHVNKISHAVRALRQDKVKGLFDQHEVERSTYTASLIKNIITRLDAKAARAVLQVVSSGKRALYSEWLPVSVVAEMVPMEIDRLLSIEG